MKLSNFLNELRATTKPSEKMDVLKKYDCPELRTLITYAYEPFTLFNVKLTAKDVTDYGTKDICQAYFALMTVAEFCMESQSSKQNKERIIGLLGMLDAGSQELVMNTFNKNWKAGLGAKNILKVFPGIVSQFEVQLANTYKPDNKTQAKVRQWYASYKFDGVRCIALRNDTGWKMLSRKGKEWLTVEHIKPQLEKIYQGTGLSFFDGEIYKHGLPFETVQSMVSSYTKGQSPELEYHIFLGGDAEKFLSASDQNHVTLTKFFCHAVSSKMVPSIKFAEQKMIFSKDIYEELANAFEQGYEGIMLRDPNKLYDYKRSNALLKLKEDNAGNGEEISDCIVDRIEVDKYPTIGEDGVMKYENLMVRIFVTQKDGTECKVGSGFTEEFRRLCTTDYGVVVGKSVEIKHQGYGANGRMRFPRLFRVREDL